MTAQPNLAGFDELLPLEESDFSFFQGLIYELAGIAISEKKIDLVASRLRAHVLKLGLGSYGEYRDRLALAPPGSDDLQTFINLLTTNKTSFFREPQHFSYLVDQVVPLLKEAPRRKISVWCAACSTGEEPYSIAMLLKHHLPPTHPFEVLATDIDTEVLATAKNGVYQQSRMEEIPNDYWQQCISVGKGKANGWFKVNDGTHRTVVFRQHNLMDAAGPGEQGFDVIFCRNVLIYFSQATTVKLAAKLHRLLRTDGLLFIGHTESIPDVKRLFKSVRPSILSRQ